MYSVLLARLKSGDLSVDYRVLRMEYAKSADYNPYSNDGEKREAMSRAVSEKKYDEALAAAGGILKKNYVDLESHLVSRLAFRRLGNNVMSSYHDSIVKGLIRSITDSGDGSKPESAYLVINVKEEYDLLMLKGYSVVKQSILKQSGHTYDVLDAVHSQSGQKEVIYFNVDVPVQWLEQSFVKNKRPAGLFGTE